VKVLKKKRELCFERETRRVRVEGAKERIALKFF